MFTYGLREKGNFAFAQMSVLKFSQFFADSLAGFQTYIVACLVWGMPSVQYGSPFSEMDC